MTYGTTQPDGGHWEFQGPPHGGTANAGPVLTVWGDLADWDPLIDEYINVQVTGEAAYVREARM
eukprot:1415312-Prymnesium_polylepis.2